MSIIGGGGYGLAVLSDNLITKYFYEIEECNKIIEEANIQRRVRQIFIDNNINIKVPEIYNVYTRRQKLELIDKDVLCGIEMEYIKPLKCIDNIHSQIHLAFGYNGTDIDTEWLVSNSGIPRGFYMSSELLEIVLDELKSELTINDITSRMGKGISLLLDNNIIPNDIEWIIDEDLNIWMIDFGLCREGYMSKEKYLNKIGLEGLANDIYVPKKEMNGYDSFISSYFKS